MIVLFFVILFLIVFITYAFGIHMGIEYMRRYTRYMLDIFLNSGQELTPETQHVLANFVIAIVRIDPSVVFQGLKGDQ